MKNIVLMGFSVAVLAMIFAPTTAAMSHKVKIEPPVPVNAFLEGNIPSSYPYSEEKADVELLVYIKEIDQYSTEIKGDWMTYRYLVKCDVIEITVGQWADKELRFVCYDRWPTPESGIMLGKLPFSYSVEDVFNFKLQYQPESSLPRIIRQEQRNPVPPHESLHRPKIDSSDPEQMEYISTILNAARAFFEEQSESNIDGTRIVHEADDYYVVVNLRHKDSVGVSRYVVINKETLEAESPPRPCIQEQSK